MSEERSGPPSPYMVRGRRCINRCPMAKVAKCDDESDITDSTCPPPPPLYVSGPEGSGREGGPAAVTPL